MVADVEAWRYDRDDDAVKRALDDLRPRAYSDRTSCRRPSPSPTPAAPRASGAARCARCSASTGHRRVWPPASAPGPPGLAAVAERSQRCRAGRHGCSWPSPGSTGTPTEPSRSRSQPATPAWRSSTRGSGSPPSRSQRSPGTRTSTWSGCRSCPAATSQLVPDVVRRLRGAGVDAPVVVGGIIPDEDRGHPARRRRGGGLHAPLFRPDPHHGRDRRSGRAPPGTDARRPDRPTRVRRAWGTGGSPSAACHWCC